VPYRTVPISTGNPPGAGPSCLEEWTRPRAVASGGDTGHSPDCHPAETPGRQAWAARAVCVSHGLIIVANCAAISRERAMNSADGFES
jgi:hypothetical protein